MASFATMLPVESSTVPDEEFAEVPPYVKPQIHLANTIFLPFVAIMTLIGNAAVMVAFYKVPGLSRKPSNLLILNLSIADFMHGWIPLAVSFPYSILGRNPYGEIGCAVAICYTEYIALVSLATLCAISFERVMLVSKDYQRYLKLMTRVRIQVVIALCWVLALIAPLSEISVWKMAKRISVKASRIDFTYSCLAPGKTIKALSLAVSLTFSFVPLFLITVMSLLFVYFLRKRLKKNQRVHMEVVDVTDHREPLRENEDGVPRGIPTTSRRVWNDDVPSVSNSLSANITSAHRWTTSIGTRSGVNIDDRLAVVVIPGHPEIVVTSAASCRPVDDRRLSDKMTRKGRRSSQKLANEAAKDTGGDGDIPTKSSRRITFAINSVPAVKDRVRADSNNRHTWYIKPAITFAVLVLALAICMTPGCVYIMTAAICPNCVAGIDSKIRKSLLTCVYVNSMLNPFLYAMTNRKIIRYHKTVLIKAWNFCRRQCTRLR